MDNKRPLVVLDDGSTTIKLSTFKGDELLTYFCAHSFGKEHKPATGDNPSFNITIEGNRFHFTGSSNALSTTNAEFQESDIDLAAIHYALLNSGLVDHEVNPEIDVVVTLPITQYYNFQNGSTLSKNLTNIEMKKRAVQRDVLINNGIEQKNDTNVYTEITPFKIKNVEVMPEGIPAIMTSLFEQDVDQFAITLLGDLGGTTLDLALIEGELLSISPYGYEDINVNNVIEAVRKAWGGSQSQARISYMIANRDNKILWEKTFRNPEKRNLVLSALNTAVEDLQQKVISAFKKLHKHPDYIFLVGGGAPLIIDAVKEEFEPDSLVIMIPNPQTALAREIAMYFAVNDESVASPELEEV